MKQFSRPDGSRYYGYMLLYDNDALCINMDADAELHQLDRYFKMKEGFIGSNAVVRLSRESKLDFYSINVNTGIQ